MAEHADISAQDAQTAAELQADVSVEHIGNVYAQALLGAAEKTGQTEAALAEFDEIVGGVLDRQPKFAALLASALISVDDKAAVLERVFAASLSPLMLNFLKVVSRHGRLDCLRAIHREARRLHDAAQGRVRVQLTTATAVDSALVARIAEQLRTALGAEPVVSHRTDANLIGGAVLRIGDTVYDASIANQLQVLRQQMIDRSAHEIQSRRDRFRAAAGN